MALLPRPAGAMLVILSVALVGACGDGSTDADPATASVPAVTATLTKVATTSASPPTTTPTTTDVRADAWPESVLTLLVVDDNPQREGYDRDDWGGGWSDADRDCLNTRHEELMTTDLSGNPLLRADGCLVIGGSWLDPFTGRIFKDPKDLDIDHFVPLANAHRSGGWAWDQTTKKRFANDLDDPRHLVAVDKSANRSKGDKGPEEWTPRTNIGPEGMSDCEYGDAWMDVKVRWGLTVTSKELAKLREMLSTCDIDPFPTAIFPPVLTLGEPIDLGRSLDDGSEAGPTDDGATPPNPGDAKNCGDFTTYAEAKAWFDAYVKAYGDVARLDRDGDGEPCESLPGSP